MNRHLIRLQRHSIAAIVMLFIVTLMPGATTWAGPPDAQGCHTHKDCGSTEVDSGAMYTVEVKFWDDGAYVRAGWADPVDGSGNESRPKIGNTDMQLNLTEMSLAMMDAGPGSECLNSGDFASNVTMLNGEFGVSASTRPKTSTDGFTYIAASFWNFTVSGSVYFLVFGPEGNAKIPDQGEGRWPPDGASGDSNTMLGTLLELKVINGPAKKGPCDKLTISLDWEVLVTKK